jgi:phage repressor protein C with HTH and peptisase S24 domain
MGFKERLREGLDREARRLGSPTQLAREAGVDQATISRYFNQGQGLGFETVAKLLDRFGGRLVWPDDPADTRTAVRFVRTLVNHGAESLPAPSADNYRAIPLVAEVSAGPGRIPEERLESWVLIYAHEPSVRLRADLVAVRVSKGERSMAPLLQPGDIVVVDRGERTPKRDGAAYLVRYPGTGDGAIKRVRYFERNKRAFITFYSDNFLEYPPDVFDVEADFGGEIENAIVGRCVWHWSDMEGK